MHVFDFNSDSSLVDAWKDSKWVVFLFLGLVVHILSMFSPLSNKLVNNLFYIAIMLPVVMLTRKEHVKALFSLNMVKLALIYAVYTSVAMAFTLQIDKLKYWVYALCLLFAFYHLHVYRLINPRVFAYSLGGLVLFYALSQLFWFYAVKNMPLGARPWFYGWQLFVPTYLSAYLAVVFAVAGFYLLEQKKYLFLFLFVSLVGLVFFLTVSRMGLAGLAPALPVFFILWWKLGSNSLSSKSLGVAFLFFVVMLGLYKLGLFDSLTARGGSYRPKIWAAAWADALKCGIWFGCGYDYSFKVTTGKGFQITEHSIYFCQILRSGLVGFSFMMATIAAAVISGLKTRTPWLLAFITGCGCLLVEGQSLIAQPRAITQFLFWIPFCMIMLAEIKAKTGKITGNCTSF